MQCDVASAKWTIVLLALVPVAASQAQMGTESRPRSIRVEQGFADVDSPALIRVDNWVDLRQEIGWESVFRLESKDRFGQTEVLFARRSGNVSAVFPRSVYTWTRRGPIIEVPPGTVFHIGDLEDLAGEPDTPPRAPTFVDRLASQPAGSAITAQMPTFRRDDRQAGSEPPVMPQDWHRVAQNVEMQASFWTDEFARRMVIASRVAEARMFEQAADRVRGVGTNADQSAGITLESKPGEPE